MIRLLAIVCYLLMVASAGSQMIPGGSSPMIPSGGGGGGGGSTAPFVTAVSPGSGVPAGGTSVVISGINFTGVTAVAFGGTPAASFSFVNSSTINATSPAGTGVVDVRVTTPVAQSGVTPADQFTYAAAPVVTALMPNSGLPAGGTPVVITGTGFTGVTAVAFGSTPATSFSFVNSTTINATSPAGSGVVDVRVTTPVGQSGIVVADRFTYTGGGGCSNSMDFSQACNSQYIGAL